MTPTIHTDDPLYQAILDIAILADAQSRPILSLALLMVVRASLDFPHSKMKRFLNGIADVLDAMRR